MKHASEFFAYARERHAIYLRRAAGQQKPWSEDKIFRQNKFTNVFRELDRVTVWFRKNVRDPLKNKPEVLLATVVFRMFNRIETGEAIFCQTTVPPKGWTDGSVFDKKLNPTAFDLFLYDGDVRHLRRAIVHHIGDRGPYTTGSYIISSPPGYSKLDGVLKILGDFYKNSDWREIAQGSRQLRGREPLFDYWEWLRSQSYLGKFHSYEIVTDLRHTALLKNAPDVLTWANVGPGARRGINRVMGRDKKFRISDEHALEEMLMLLEMSTFAEYWPKWSERGGFLHRNFDMPDLGVDHKKTDWSLWEMRDVEHTLCEFDKYMRLKKKEKTKTGRQAKPRGSFDGG